MSSWTLYGTVSASLDIDIELCLEVWRDAHRFEITDFLQHASSTTLDLSSKKHRVEVFQHAMLYGGDENRERAVKDLAADIVSLADTSFDFSDLNSKQMAQVFSCKHLVASEDEKLEIMWKWRMLKSAGVSADEVDDVLRLLRWSD